REEVATHLEACAACQGEIERLLNTPQPAAPVPTGPEPRAAFLIRLKNCYNLHADTRPRPEAPPAPPPTWPDIPGYEMVDVLGIGAMGVVYKARDTRLNRVVAVKVIGGRLADSRAMIRFRAEAEAAAAVRHPNVVQVYESGYDGGCPYMVLEYLPGGT